MQASPVAEVRSYGKMMLDELRKIIPSFLTRVDLEDRGQLWSRYLADVSSNLREIASDLEGADDPGPSVELTDWDPEAEVKLVAAALYSVSELADSRLQRIAGEMTPSHNVSRCFARWRAAGKTEGTSRAEPWNEPPTDSTSSVTSEHFEISSDTE